MTIDESGNIPLHYAAGSGHLSIVQYFLDHCKCDAMIINKKGSMPLHVAALNGHLSVVQYFINDCNCEAIVHVTDENGNTPLHMAAQNGHLSIVKYFINDCKCNAMVSNKNGSLSLHMAAQNGHLSVVQYLINDCNCDAMTADDDGATPVHKAAEGGHISIVQYLVNDCNCHAMVTDKNQNTPLHMAALNGHLSVIQYFINNCNCNAMIIDNNGSTSLHKAALNGHLSVVQYFTNCYSDIVVADNNGDTPLHCAAENGHLSVVEYFINDCNCNAMIANKSGNTPLHVAALNGHLSVVRYFSDCYIDVMIADDNGNTPLHYAAKNGHLSVIEYFINHCSYHATITNKNGNTPLDMATLNGHLPVVQFFINVCNCDAMTTDQYGSTNLHYAASNGHLSLVQYFINDCHCNAKITNKTGSTPLHMAALNGHLSVVEYFIDDYNCDAMINDKNGATPLQYATSNGHLLVVQYFIENCDCDVLIKNDDGDTLLHEAARRGHLSLVQYFINDCNCDVMISNEYKGSTPLHHAASNGHLSVVQYFVNDCNCDAMITDKNGAIPLHYAAQSGHLSVVQYFINDCNCDAMIARTDGTTPLHFAAFKGHLSVVQYLINDCNCDAMVADTEGSTPFHFACQWNYNNRNIPVIQYLLSIPTVLSSFSTDSTHNSPLYDAQGDAKIVYDRFQKVKVSHPVGLFVNILLLGNAGAGKTTLCQVIKERSTVHITTEERVEQVNKSTLGIVPTKFNDRNLGNVIIHDFAGQPEYYSSHAAVLENLLQNCGAVFVVLINLTQDILPQIKFWSSIVSNECQKVTSECHLIIIGSHADEISQSSLKRILFNLEGHISKELGKANIASTTSMFHLDCRLLSGDNLEAFASKLSSLCASVRNKQSPAISLYCNFLYFLLDAMVSEKNSCTLHQLMGLCNKSRQKGVPLPDDIVPSLKTLHSTGLIVYLENKKDIMKSWIVVKKEVLLTKVDGILFAPTSFIEHVDIASNTGIITTGALHRLFPDHPIEMLIMFLKSMKLCEEFDETLLKVTNLQASINDASSTDVNERLLFFPALIAEKRPQKLNDREFAIGWCYRFSSGIMFSIRFLHILLLHLAYGFALPVRDDHPLLPFGLQRHCLVWINGIHWYNDDGVEILVEQVEDNQCVVMLMSCLSSAKEEMIKLHCELIHSITSLQYEYCPMLQCTEYLIDPLELHYPLDKPSQLTCYNMKKLISQIASSKEVILCENNSGKPPIKIAELLPIEPMKYWSMLNKSPTETNEVCLHI